MNPIIKVENLSKQYRLGQVGTGTMKDDLKRWWYKARGKEDPFLTVGEQNDRTQKGGSEYVWALKDINFSVQPGEVLGIIGRNGAGKSTLLKLLSRVTEPTTGRIAMRGRVASLLEVGTGFHPDLTGRENIYLNGAILGMTKKEITRKFDEIVDFSGIERYIDTPVKRYSSGMHVRLGFAVAAHLEPEILIVDEVLAVGDAEFQKKCLGKMKSVSTNEGRTVIFVSHNLSTIQSLCGRCMLLEKGLLIGNGNTDEILELYISSKKKVGVSISKYELNKNKNCILENIWLLNHKSEDTEEIEFGGIVYVRLQVSLNAKFQKFRAAVGITNQQEIPVWTFFSEPIEIIPGKYQIDFEVKDVLMASGEYTISVGLSENDTPVVYYDNVKYLSISEVRNNPTDTKIFKTNSVGLILNSCNTTIKEL